MNDYLIYFIIGAMLLSYILSAVIEMGKKISRLEKKLNKIAEHLGIEDTAPVGLEGELLQLISEGKKIAAIKKYRNVTGVDLKDAKDYIDALAIKSQS